METTSRVGAQSRSATRARRAARAQRPRGAGGPADGRRLSGADFPWYGLDEAFTGPRWLMQVGAAADGTVEHGSTGHGDEPSLGRSADRRRRSASRWSSPWRATRAPQRRRHRRPGGHLGLLGRLAGRLGAAGLHLARPDGPRAARATGSTSRPRPPGSSPTTWTGPDWSTLSLPVDGVPTPFHYRESEYGWVLAGSARRAVCTSVRTGGG